MAKKQQEEKEPTPQANPEATAAEQEYRRSKMIVEARPKLKRLGILLWMAFDIVLVVIFIGYIGVYLSAGMFGDKKTIATIAEDIDTMHAISESHIAESLRIGDAKEFSLGGDEYDFYAIVGNPNEEWFATFTYYFSSSAGDSEKLNGAVMPLSESHLVAIRQQVDSRPVGSDLIVEDIEWHRVDAKEISDIEEWLEEHNKFDVMDAEYSLDLEVADENIARTSFTLNNNTPYSYWNPEFIVLITRAGSVAGVNTVTVNGFASGESREMDVNWFGSVPSSGSVEVISNINYFDDEEYMPLAGDVEADLRDDFVDDRRR